MPEISKIKLTVNQEEQTFEIEDKELREALKVLVGSKEENKDQEGN